MKYELKTKATSVSVEKFIAALKDTSVQKDCKTIIALMKKATNAKPTMWGPSIIGFGRYHYVYDSGHEGDMCITGFSPRKPYLTLYVMGGSPGNKDLLKKLGKHKTGKACLYIKSLNDVDVNVLEKLIKRSVEFVKKKYTPAK